MSTKEHGGSKRKRANKKGWVRLYRSVMDSPVFNYKKEGLLKLFIYCILRASHKPRIYKGTMLESGQFVFGAVAASAKLCINECTLRRRMKQLKVQGVVTCKVTDLGTIVTICNWETYQSANLKSDGRSDARSDAEAPKSDGQSDGQSDYLQECDNKNVSNKNYIGTPEGKPKPSPPKRPAHPKNVIPPTLDMVADYCRENAPTIEPQRFIDHYEANGWMVGKTRMKDWQAAVRTWKRNQSEHGGRSFGNRPQQPATTSPARPRAGEFSDASKDRNTTAQVDTAESPVVEAHRALAARNRLEALRDFDQVGGR